MTIKTSLVTLSALLVALSLTLLACDKEATTVAPAGQAAPGAVAIPDKPAEAPDKAPAEPIEGHPDDWCGGHGLPESMCTKCNPELTAKFKEKGDWCATHGFPESACPMCNPMKAPTREVAVGKADDWCGGHGLPESMCTKCNPELAAKFKEKGDWCGAHGFPESVCPVCSPMKAPATP